MAKKGIDRMFLHYGIRATDMNAINQLCEEHELDAEWVKENILKAFHEKRLNDIDLDDSKVESIINNALHSINR